MKLRLCRTGLTTIIVIYVNCVLTNLVSLRQQWYTETYRNGTAMEPLHDTLFVDWMPGYDIPFQDTITLRDFVDVLTYTWVLLTLLVWSAFNRDPILLARALTAQIILVPTFSISQLLTIVPDATPNCLTVYQIPSTPDMGWVFWKYPSRACGNMLWSSDITQLVIFTSFATQMITDRKPCLKWFIWALGECWTFATVIFIFTARYQYSVDVLSTIVVVKLAMSHHFVDQFAKYCFIRKGNYYARAPSHELARMTI